VGNARHVWRGVALPVSSNAKYQGLTMMPMRVYEQPERFRVGFVAGFYEVVPNDRAQQVADLLRSHLKGGESDALFLAGYGCGCLLRQHGSCARQTGSLLHDVPTAICPSAPNFKGGIMRRESIVRELAIQSLQGAVDLEDHLQTDLIASAAREGVTLHELIRERLLLKAGVATVGALSMLTDRLMRANQILKDADTAATEHSEHRTPIAA
jgi:hypothetical protein